MECIRHFLTPRTELWQTLQVLDTVLDPSELFELIFMVPRAFGDSDGLGFCLMRYKDCKNVQNNHIAVLREDRNAQLLGQLGEEC